MLRTSIAALLLVLTACAHTARAPRADDRAELIALTLQYAEAFGRNDVDALDRLRLPEFQFITSTGRIVPKEVELADIRSGIARADSAVLSEVDARVRGDTALVTARASLKGEWYGRRYDGSYRLSMTWVRSSEGWRLLSEQASRIADR